MDKTSVFGTVAGFLLLVIGIKLNGSVMAFVNIPSLFVVFGAAFGGLCVGYSYDMVRATIGMVKECYIAPREYNYLKMISSILMTAEIARKEGILALDSRLSEIEDPFMARGLQMVVDGVDVKIIEEVLNTELDSRSDRHTDVREAVDFIGSVVPAFGLIGTIMGLVGLLGNLDDPSSIGPNMALALVTTFYGAVAANLLFVPYSRKIALRSTCEQLYGEIIARGCLLIAAGTHPRIIQERLLAFLSEKDRILFNELHLAEELNQGG